MSTTSAPNGGYCYHSRCQQGEKGEEAVQKCISFLSPTSSTQKLYRLIELCESYGIVKSRGNGGGNQREKNVFIYTSPENIQVANRIRDAFAKMISPKKTSSSSGGSVVVKPTIIIDSFKDDYYTKPYYLYSSITQIPKNDILVIVITNKVNELEKILHNLEQSQDINSLFQEESPKEDPSFQHIFQNYLPHRHRHHLSRHPHPDLKTECKIASLVVKYQCATPPQIETFFIRDDISHSKKLHESPLFPFEKF